MAFKFGDFDTAAVPGITATLVAWPTPALGVESVDGLDGLVYGRTRMGESMFTFDILLEALTPAGALELRDKLVAACSPAAGLQLLEPEIGDGWAWKAAVAHISEFERGLWLNNVECQLNGQITFVVPEGVGYAVPDETASGTSAATLTRTKGNLDSFPTVTIEGTFSSVTLTAGSWSIDVDAPVGAGQRLVLDYQAMEFGVWAGAVKVAHAAGGMSRFDRLAVPLGAATFTVTATGGAVTALAVEANSRRA